MNNLTSTEIRERFLKFFEKREHAIVPSASLVPENDPSVLFNTAGMQQFKPYYLGKDALSQFGSKNTASVQKCVRTSDIDEVGDDTHLTFFEMLGNFSFGGYWKKEAIVYAHEFITKELGLKIDYVSVFRDDESGIPADEESREIWKSIDPSLEIRDHKKEDNFWGPTGEEGPCGPTTEIYINGVEIWNIVFNEYYKTKFGEFVPLELKGIDTGMGLERLLVQVQNKKNVYETDVFDYLLLAIKPNDLGEIKNRSARIIADHIRTSVFMINDGVVPSNTDRGYILRRLLRRAYIHAKKINVDIDQILSISNLVMGHTVYKNIYKFDTQNTKKVITEELNKFGKTLEDGLKQFEKGIDPFVLFTSYGFPIELTEELAKEKGIKIDKEKFLEDFKKHQDISRQGSEQKFKGGLSGTGEVETRYHTAAHLLHQALRDVLDGTILCKGSNITPERLRFDFPFDRKLTAEEIKAIEDKVNEKIALNLPVNKVVMKKDEAEKTGALHIFNERYPDEVNVYYIGDNIETAYSKEFCGGPHVERTGLIGKFKISKEEASSAGVRRIKAILE
jgi:alanyl-tRNA synthetase